MEQHESFSDSTLVLVGHGSTLNPDSASPVYLQAERVRESRLFTEVLECFWKLEPNLAAVLRGAFTSRVFIVPLFISEGYFTEQVIPRELGFCDNEGTGFPCVQERNGQTLYYCGPVGTHESMTEAILARAKSTAERYPYPRAPKPAETDLFIAGHGTKNNAHSRQAIEHQVEKIREQGEYRSVHAIFMEEAPYIQDCYKLSQGRYLMVVPFFMSDGLHSYEDIPVMLGEPEKRVQQRFQQGQPTWRNPTEKRGKLVWYAPSVGDEPNIVKVIVQRASEAKHWPRSRETAAVVNG